MREAGIALLLVLALAALALVQLLPAVRIIETGQALMLGAAAVGLPLQVVYFSALAIALSGRRPEGWYWRSFDHHHLLTPVQRRIVLPIFTIAALAFVAILLGIVVTTVGLIDLVVEA